MTGTRMCSMSDIVSDRADGYTQSATGVKNAEIWLTVRPSGAFLSTVADLAKWDAALWDNKILSEESRAQMWTPARLADGSQCGYGLGWFVDAQQGRRRVRHDGGVPGFTADFERYLDDRLAVIVLTNSGSAEPASMAQHIAGLAVPALAAEVKKPIVDPEPQLATVVRRLIDGVMKNNLDRSLFAADVAPHISDAVVEHLSHELAGEVKAVELMERSQREKRVASSIASLTPTTVSTWNSKLIRKARLLTFKRVGSRSGDDAANRITPERSFLALQSLDSQRESIPLPQPSHWPAASRMV